MSAIEWRAVCFGDVVRIASKGTDVRELVIVLNPLHQESILVSGPVGFAADGQVKVERSLGIPKYLHAAEWRPLEVVTQAQGVARDHVRAAVRALTAGMTPVFCPPAFDAAAPRVSVTGKSIDANDVQMVIDSALDSWFTTGRFNEQFEMILSRRLGLRKVLTTNSGSSANLLAVTALTSHELGEQALKPGDEVITVAAGFPTTVNPLIQNGLVPVFVDVQLETLNIDPAGLRAALSDNTRAIVLAHTLGNAFDVESVVQFAREHGLWLIEDCCDALGSTYTTHIDTLTSRPVMVSGPPGMSSADSHASPVNKPMDEDGNISAPERPLGTFGHICTFSFYPAHHVTMGEGGAIGTNSPLLARIIESLRDWGRDCWCPPGCDNTCGKRFGWQLGDLPPGYDHKYIYSHVGYNLKITDMQAALGCSQLEKLDHFVEKRRTNFRNLLLLLSDLSEWFVMPEPQTGSNPAWFGFPLTIRPGTSLSRNDVVAYLEGKGVATRLLFAGNMVRQPYMKGRKWRSVSNLKNTDIVMNNTFWLGIHPGLSADHIQYVSDVLHAAIQEVG